MSRLRRITPSHFASMALVTVLPTTIRYESISLVLDAWLKSFPGPIEINIGFIVLEYVCQRDSTIGTKIPWYKRYHADVKMLCKICYRRTLTCETKYPHAVTRV